MTLIGKKDADLIDEYNRRQNNPLILRRIEIELANRGRIIEKTSFRYVLRPIERR